MNKTCRTCGRAFASDEDAYASDWTVIEPDGLRMETRYQHIACGDAPTPWRCELHDVVTAGDCPRCDDDLISIGETA
jgi:Zn finger protein HypA/HybF involved in hydrogenase expression